MYSEVSTASITAGNKNVAPPLRVHINKFHVHIENLKTIELTYVKKTQSASSHKVFFLIETFL